MKVLFLSPTPQEDYRKVYARQLNARIKILPFHKLIRLAKIYPRLNNFYLNISFIYSFFIHLNEDILIVDGGSSLFTAFYLKRRYKKIKLVYLDNDVLFYDLDKSSKFSKNWLMYFIKEIDGVISDSNQSKKFSSSFLDVPIEVCACYPNAVRKKVNIRKNYGLYVGRLDSDKDIQRIINFGLQCPYFEKFIVIGDGAYRAYVKKMSKKHGKIIYDGIKSNVEDYYSKCKFLIHIPDFDPHPRTTMEAALCGCFPIISKGVGTNYLFDEIFIVNNSESFAKINMKIKYILDHENKARKLLQKSLTLIPTKKQSIKNFKTAFFRVMEQIK